MRKTSVYLPEEAKAALRDVAQRWDRSEAELIRLAIERLVRAAETAAGPSGRPPVVRLEGPRLVGVGVGPSAPDLVTRRAVDVVSAADRVVTASSAPDAVSRAEAIVRTVAPEVAVDRLPVAIGDDPTARSASLDAAAGTLVAALDRGEVVAFVTLGDPNVYSVFPSIARLVSARRPDVPVEVVPGVMAFQELAARTGTVLAEGGEHLEVMAADGDLSAFEAALGRPASTVIAYKGGRHLPDMAERLRASGRLDGAVLGELLGLPGGRWAPVAAVADRPASYLATVVVPAAGRRPTETPAAAGPEAAPA